VRVSTSTNRRLGIARVCRLAGTSRSGVYLQRERRRRVRPLQRRGPKPTLSDEALVALIRQDLAESPFFGEGHRKVWARLRVRKNVRTTRRRILRLMREHRLLAPQRAGHPHGPKAHDGTITTERPDEMWGTDMTRTLTLLEGSVAVFVAVDHCTAECIGLHAAKDGNRFEALEVIRQGVREHLGGFKAGVGEGLKIRHDHGSCYMSDVFQGELMFLGMESSPAFVREPEGNGCAERFIRTLKEQLLWVSTFKTLAELQAALAQFKETYNKQWLIGRHGHRTPAEVLASFVGDEARAA